MIAHNSWLMQIAEMRITEKKITKNKGIWQEKSRKIW